MVRGVGYVRVEPDIAQTTPSWLPSGFASGEARHERSEGIDQLRRMSSALSTGAGIGARCPVLAPAG